LETTTRNIVVAIFGQRGRHGCGRRLPRVEQGRTSCSERGGVTLGRWVTRKKRNSVERGTSLLEGVYCPLCKFSRCFGSRITGLIIVQNYLNLKAPCALRFSVSLRIFFFAGGLGESKTLLFVHTRSIVPISEIPVRDVTQSRSFQNRAYRQNRWRRK
jgi:hypothetical protein